MSHVRSDRECGSGQFSRNPRFCNFCVEFCHQYPGGTELEISMLLVDVRGSRRLAEGMRAADFSGLMNRFYKDATGALICVAAGLKTENLEQR